MTRTTLSGEVDTVVVALSVCGDHMPEWRSAQGKTVHSCCAHVKINGVLVQDCRYAGRREERKRVGGKEGRVGGKEGREGRGKGREGGWEGGRERGGKGEGVGGREGGKGGREGGWREGEDSLVGGEALEVPALGQ